MKFFLFGLIIIISSCSLKPDLEREKQKLLVLHDQQRTAHFDKNVRNLMAEQSDDFLQIQNGDISRPSLAERTRRMQAYFDRITFDSWDDTEPPIIEISDDATMANTFVKKLVVTKLKNGSGKTTLDTTRFAWTTTYKKIDGQWRMTAITSTRQ